MTTPEQGPAPTRVFPRARSSGSRARRFYAIDRDLRYPLRDAARAMRLPEGKLRRAILLDELPAEAVDDDRHYVLDGAALQNYLRNLKPAELCVFPESATLLQDLFTLLVIPALLLVLLFLGRFSETERRPGPARIPANAIHDNRPCPVPPPPDGLVPEQVAEQHD